MAESIFKMSMGGFNRIAYNRERRDASRHTAKPDVRKRIFSRDNYTCQLCGGKNNLTIDHIKSVYLYGAINDDSNLRTLCRSCNCRLSPNRDHE